MSVQGAADARLDADHGQRLDRAAARRLRIRAVSTYAELVRQREQADPANPLSLDNCEKVSRSAQSGDSAGVDVVRASLAADVAPAHLAGVLGKCRGYAGEAILESMGRSRERQRTTVALVEAGEVAHARRFAICMRKSAQLECPPMAGGCGSRGNYVPITCDSRLCPECGKRRQGQNVAKYGPVVAGWDWPTLVTLTSPGRVQATAEDIEAAHERLRNAFGRLRNRVVPADGPGWSWTDWRRKLIMAGARKLARAWELQYVDQGRGIPFNEVMQSGFYAFDDKEQPDGRLNIHIHIAADVPWVPQAALSHMWEELIGAEVTDIRRVDGRGGQDAEKAALEVVGYAAKAPEFSSTEAKVEYLKAVKGSKLVQPFGALHGNTPDIHGRLRCSECDAAPGYWDYVDIVNGTYDNMRGDWRADGDRPPP